MPLHPPHQLDQRLRNPPWVESSGSPVADRPALSCSIATLGSVPVGPAPPAIRRPGRAPRDRRGLKLQLPRPPPEARPVAGAELGPTIASEASSTSTAGPPDEVTLAM